jgi:hypothetical protein
VPCIILRKFYQSPFLTPARSKNIHPVPALFSQDFRQHFVVIWKDGNEYLPRDVSHRKIETPYRSTDQLAGGGTGCLPEEPGLPPQQVPVSHTKHYRTDMLAGRGYGQHVAIAATEIDGGLAAAQDVQSIQDIPQFGRSLKFQSSGSFLHLAADPRPKISTMPPQHVEDLVDHGAVIFL